jgi:hypothetical protein
MVLLPQRLDGIVPVSSVVARPWDFGDIPPFDG